MFTIIEYTDEEGINYFQRWLSKLDKKIKARIQARIFRFELGNLGDSKSVSDGVFEARFHFGSGYRLYFGRDEEKIIVLLIGGDKSTQSKDIRMAKKFWLEYQEHKNA